MIGSEPEVDLAWSSYREVRHPIVIHVPDAGNGDTQMIASRSADVRRFAVDREDFRAILAGVDRCAARPLAIRRILRPAADVIGVAVAVEVTNSSDRSTGEHAVVVADQVHVRTSQDPDPIEEASSSDVGVTIAVDVAEPRDSSSQVTGVGITIPAS